MSTEVRWRRGTTAQHTTFTGASGEVTLDSTKNTLVVHDGSTPGGHPLASAASIQWATLEQFGAKGNGVVDDTAAIQAAINSGRSLLVGSADAVYRITSTLTVDHDHFELDLQGATLLLDDATGLKDHIKLGNGTTRRSGIRLTAITFTRQQVATAGYAVNSDLIGVCTIAQCRVFGDSKIFSGVRVYRGIMVTLQNNYIDGCISRGVQLLGSGLTSNRTVDVVLRGNRIDGGVTALTTGDFVEGVFCRDNIFYGQSSHCVVVDATVDANGLLSFKFQENDFDTSGGYGLYIDKVNNVQVTGCWFSANTQDSLVIKELTSGVVVVGNQLYPTASGIYAYGASARIASNLISGGTNSIKLAPTATRTDINGNTLSNAQYGIDFGAAANTHFVANSIYGTTGAATTGTIGTGSVVQNNKGDTDVGVSSFVTVGASPFTYTAGPRPECVAIYGGTVSQITLNGNAVSFTSGRDFTLAPGQAVVITHSAAPFLVKNVL